MYIIPYILPAIRKRIFEMDGDAHEMKTDQALSATPSDDRKTRRATLRKEIKFSSGEDLNADAYIKRFTLGPLRPSRIRRPRMQRNCRA